MKKFRLKLFRSLAPATDGNPAYPSLAAREKLIAKNKRRSEFVKKIPADQLREYGSEDKKEF